MITKHGGPRRRGCYRIPTRGEPLVRQFFELLNLACADGSTLAEVCARAGVSVEATTNWRTIRSPRLSTLQAALNVLGHELRIARVELRDRAAGEPLHGA